MELFSNTCRSSLLFPCCVFEVCLLLLEIHLHIYTHTRTYTYTYTCIYTHTHTHIYIYMYACPLSNIWICTWASLVAQLVKNPPAMREAWVGSLGWEDRLEKGKAPHSSILAWRIPWTLYSPRGRREFYKAALVLLNSLSVCWSGKLFVSLWTLT